MNKLIANVALKEEINRDSEGLDKDVLFEAAQLDESDFSEPLDAQALLLQLAEEGLV